MAAPKKKGLSLYADLLPSAGIISSAPVKYGAEGDTSSDGNQPPKKLKDASLQFQPVPRPGPKAGKPKPAFPAAASPPTSVHNVSAITEDNTNDLSKSTTNLSDNTPAAGKLKPPQLGQKRPGFNDWVGDEDEEDVYYSRPKPARKKNKRATEQSQSAEDWNAIYDPTRPTNQDAWKKSAERWNKVAEWKAYLYAANAAKRKYRNTEHESTQPAVNDENDRATRVVPPSNLSFAPPAVYDSTDVARQKLPEVKQHSAAMSVQTSNDDTGEDAYARRLRMSAMPETQMPPMPQIQAQSTFAPMIGQPDSSAASEPADDEAAKKAQVQASIKAKIEAFQRKALEAKREASLAKEPQQDFTPPPPPPPPNPPPSALHPADSAFTAPQAGISMGSISRAPVRYQVADVPTVADPSMDITQEEQKQYQSKPPPKESFGKQYMKKMGWDVKKGLGAQEQGIVTAYEAKLQKQKKHQNEKGVWSKAPVVGKIVGGKKGRSAEDDDSLKVSLVVKLEGMLDGLDVEKEIQDNDIMQEIGDDMDKEYGKVERLFIWKESMGGSNEVFVKFTNQASAVRAVNGMDNTTFSENQIKASYWDAEKFENGVYE